MQLQTERTFLQVAASTGRPSVVVMDRGINDIQAYMPPDLWDKLITDPVYGIEISNDYINDRYDLVLHLVTAADGAEKFYTTANNAARTETAEEARGLDKLVEGGYAGLKKAGKHVRVDNSTDFKGKMAKATKAVLNMIDGKALDEP